MARITLDPDDVNQSVHVTLVDGSQLTLATASAKQLRQVARQLHVHRSTYAHAYRGPDEATTNAVAAGTRGLDDLAPLHREVKRLLAAQTQRGRGRTGRDLDPLVVLDASTWASGSGVARPLTDLTPSHRRNLLQWLLRANDELEAAFEAADTTEEERFAVMGGDPWVTGTPLYRRLHDLVEHESALEKAKDVARQQARRIAFERTGEWPPE